MSLDGKAQAISKQIGDGIGDGSSVVMLPCPACQGSYYKGRPSSQFRRCNRGHHVICVRCGSVAKRFGRKGLVCGC